MNSHEEDEEEGPSVDSAVAEERIAARRIRIQRRLEAARRLACMKHSSELVISSILVVFFLFSANLTFREASGEDAMKKKPVDSEKDALKSRKQMEESRQVNV